MRDSSAGLPPKRKRASGPSWANLSDEDLLALRLSDLDLKIIGAGLRACLRELHDELRERGLSVRPHIWISDEWFSPDNTLGIAIPFYLAHPRLARLERKMVLEVEGGTRRECMQILRHEAGHVIQHAFALQRRRRWQDLFGLSSKRYPQHYRPDPGSRDYVQHLRRWYAQSHPDEDFAETFAVWLTPRSNWRKRYADWPAALEKLIYVDELMAELAGKKPALTKRIEVDPVSALNMTLAEHYKKKRAHWAVETHSAYDRDLRQIFSAAAGHRRAAAASVFIRRNRAAIRALAANGDDENGPTLDAVLDEVIGRCRTLKLRAPGSKAQMRDDVAAMVGARVHTISHAPARQWYAL